jgi:hypothetical protein
MSSRFDKSPPKPLGSDGHLRAMASARAARTHLHRAAVPLLLARSILGAVQQRRDCREFMRKVTEPLRPELLAADDEAGAG